MDHYPKDGKKDKMLMEEHTMSITLLGLHNGSGQQIRM